MSQLCHALQFMHKKYIGCFIKPDHLIIDQNRRIKLRNLNYAYAVNEKTGWKDSKTLSTESNNPLKL